MTLERVGTPKKVFSQTKPAYEENLVWIETDGSGNIVAQYVGKFDEFIEVSSASGYPIHFDHLGDTEPETKPGDAWLETTAFSTQTVDTPTSGDNTYQFDIASLDDVFNVDAVTIIGERSTAAGGPVTISGSGTGEVNPAGTSTTDVQVVFTGVETTTSGSVAKSGATDGDSIGYNVGGNTQPRDETVTLTGKESSTSDSASLGTLSNGGSGTVSVGGNVDPSGESVTLKGRETTSSKSASGTVNGGSDTISVGGNVAGDATVTAESQSGSDTASTQYYQQDSTVEHNLVIQNGGPETSFSVDGQVSDDSSFNDQKPGANVKVYAGPSENPTNLVEEIDTSPFEDGRYTDVVGNGTIDSSSWQDTHVRVVYSHIVKEGPFYEWVNADTSVSSSSTDLSVSSGSNSATISGGGTKTITTDPTGDLTISGTGDYSVDYTETTATEDPSVTLGSSTVSDTGILRSGETTTLSGGDLSLGSNSVSVSTNGGSSVGVDASWTETTATEDPSVSVGSSTVTHTGVLGPGETVTESVNLSTGSNSASVSTNGGSSVGVSVSWTQVDATENPSVSIGGTTASFAGILTGGETATRSIDFGTDLYTATVSVTNDCETDITWTEVFETLDPTVSLNGTTLQFTGLVPEGDAVTVGVSKSSLTTGTNTLELASGAPAGLSFSYDEVDTSSTNTTVRLYYSDGSVWKEVP